MLVESRVRQRGESRSPADARPGKRLRRRSKTFDTATGSRRSEKPLSLVFKLAEGEDDKGEVTRRPLAPLRSCMKRRGGGCSEQECSSGKRSRGVSFSSTASGSGGGEQVFTSSRRLAAPSSRCLSKTALMTAADCGDVEYIEELLNEQDARARSPGSFGAGTERAHGSFCSACSCSSGSEDDGDSAPSATLSASPSPSSSPPTGPSCAITALANTAGDHGAAGDGGHHDFPMDLDGGIDGALASAAAAGAAEVFAVRQRHRECTGDREREGGMRKCFTCDACGHRDDDDNDSGGRADSASLLAGRVLSNRDLDVDAEDRDGWTALFYCARMGHADATRSLLVHGANPNHAAKGGLTALTLAAANGHAEVAKLLLKHGADADWQDSEGHSALMAACSNGHVGAALALLDPFGEIGGSGDDSDSTDAAGTSSAAVKISSSTSSVATASGTDDSTGVSCSRKARRGASVDLADKAGLTALSFAAINDEQAAFVPLLVRTFGANPNARSRFLSSPLMFAAHHRNWRFLFALLEHGANPELRDRSGTRAVVIAMRSHLLASCTKKHAFESAVTNRRRRSRQLAEAAAQQDQQQQQQQQQEKKQEEKQRPHPMPPSRGALAVASLLRRSAPLSDGERRYVERLRSIAQMRLVNEMAMDRHERRSKELARENCVK